MTHYDLSVSPPAVKSVKYYSGNYEKEEKANGDKILWNYIFAGDGLAAIYRVFNNTGKLYYVVKDHLGSIMQLYDDHGDTLEEFS